MTRAGHYVKRLARLETGAEAAWAAAWAGFVDYLDRHAPRGDVEQRIRDAGITETEAQAFMHERGLLAFDEWTDALPDVEPITDDGEKNLSRWPSDYPTPPDEPAAAWDDLAREAAEPGREGVMASVVLYALALARAVRTAKA